MNKYQEAIDYLFDKYANSTEEDSFLHRHYIDVLRELVDKATPKKPQKHDKADKIIEKLPLERRKNVKNKR